MIAFALFVFLFTWLAGIPVAVWYRDRYEADLDPRFSPLMWPLWMFPPCWLIVATMLLVATPAMACNRCGHFGKACVYQQVQQVVVQPYAVNYFVGQPIRVEALVQKSLREDPQWQAFQQFKQWQQQLQAPSTEPPKSEGPKPEAPLMPPAAAVPPSPLLVKHCAACHSGATPKKGLILDGTAHVDAKIFLAARDALRSGSMPTAPKGKPAVTLDGATQDALLVELMALLK